MEHAWAGWLGKAASTGSSGMTAAAFKKAGARNKIGRHHCTMNSSRTTLHPSERDCVSVCVCIYVQTLESLISQFLVLKAAPSLFLAKHTGQGKFGLVWTAAPNQTHMEKNGDRFKNIIGRNSDLTENDENPRNMPGRAGWERQPQPAHRE